MHGARSDGGFTLLELMVAIVVLAVAITGTLVGLGARMQLAVATKEQAIAQRAAERQMAELVSLGHAALTRDHLGTREFTPDLSGVDALELREPADGSASGVEAIALEPVNGRLLDVTVTVRWQGTVSKSTEEVVLQARVGP